MQKAPRVHDHSHVQRDPDDPECDHITRRRTRSLDPVAALDLVQVRDRIEVPRVSVAIGERRKLHPEAILVDQTDEAPAVESRRIAPPVEPGQSDVGVRPAGLEHQKRSGKRYGVNLWLFDRTRSTLSKLISPITETAV